MPNTFSIIIILLCYYYYFLKYYYYELLLYVCLIKEIYSFRVPDHQLIKMARLHRIEEIGIYIDLGRGRHLSEYLCLIINISEN